MNKILILHVAQDGCDGWSGLLPSSNEAGSDGPLKTITQARDKIRAIRAENVLNSPVEVHIHQGLYEIAETILFTEEDMGDEKTPVKYCFAVDGEVILTGSKLLTGFEPIGNGVYKLNLVGQGMRGLDFSQLFCNGVRQIMSRYPNYDPENPYGGGWLYVEGEIPSDVMGIYGEPKGVHDRFICKDSRLKNWKDISSVEIFIFPRFNWVNDIIKLNSYNPDTGEIVLSKPASYEIYPGDRFYFRNVVEEIDTPGEWYLDKDNDNLYFYPPCDLEDAVVTVPTLENIIILDGSPTKYESYNEMLELQGRELLHGQNPETVKSGYFTLEGFTIEGCEGVGVLIRNSRCCSVLGCTVRNTGSYGVRILGGAECSVLDCDVYETGGDGIFIRGGLRDEHEGNYAPAKHEARNNYVHHVGVFKKCSAGITVDGSGNTAANNLIHDSPRWGILSGGNDNLIEYNHIRHVNLETSDTGAIYFCNRNFKMRGNKVRYNLIHDIFGHHLLGGKWLPPIITYGIYLDDYTSSTEVFGNITYRTPKGGIFIHDGQDNLVENNMFLNTQKEMVTLLRSRSELEHANMGVYGQAVRRNILRRNILASECDTATVYFLDTLDNAEGKIDLDTNLCENNLIWCYDNPVMVETHFYGRMITWEQWLELGYEKQSMVADPKFVNKAANDFSLQKDSPAWELGFKPIPIDKIGPYRSEHRKTWPIIEAEGIREHPSDIKNQEKTIADKGVWYTDDIIKSVLKR